MEEVKERVTRELPYDLTDEELIARGRELAVANKDAAAQREHMKEVAKDEKAALDAIEKRVTRLSDVVATKREYRPTECQWEPNHDRSIMELVRTDTGAVVLSRPMTEDEKQQRLKLVLGKRGDRTAAGGEQ